MGLGRLKPLANQSQKWCFYSSNTTIKRNFCLSSSIECATEKTEPDRVQTLQQDARTRWENFKTISLLELETPPVSELVLSVNGFSRKYLPNTFG